MIAAGIDLGRRLGARFGSECIVGVGGVAQRAFEVPQLFFLSGWFRSSV